ncbi:phage head-tail joining protein [Paracoccus litorisediminis]|uniref:phage head-tail joining protein n=1 Tax=Paracoccus litorisediminis TaxID=2006130 RepID=UPI00373553C5
MAVSVYTQDQYQTLCRMIAKGVTSLEVNGEKVTYRSLAEMLRIKGLMEADLGATSRAPQLHYPTYRKG